MLDIINKISLLIKIFRDLGRIKTEKLAINLDISKAELRQYVNSSQYYNDIAYTLIVATQHIKKFIGQSKVCVILDIDQTAIDQYSLMLKYDFGWGNAALEESFTRTDFPAIKQTLNFYNELKKYEIPVMFLSSRREKYLNETILQLYNAGFTDYERLILRPDNDEGTIQDFKIRARKALAAEGWKIIANLGDQQSDLDGGNPISEWCFKFPNDFYLITSSM